VRVLVTGAAGFIGTHLCRVLDARGIDVVGVDCLLPDSYSADIKRENAEAVSALAHATMVIADIREDLPTSAWDGVSAVINLAAMPGLMKSWEFFDLYQSCNLTGVHRLVEQGLDRGIEHFVQISTSSVYGTLATGSEDDPLQPISPYGVTKLAGERLVAAYGASRGLPYTVLRYFSVYGPGQRPDMAYHIICERLLDGEEIPIFGDGQQTRSNTYVADIVEGTVRALLAEPSNATMNIAGGDTLSLLDAVAVLEESLGRSARLAFHPPRPGDQRHTRGDVSRAHELIGYQARTPVREGLTAQAAWHLARRA
jgi:UDP-glucuronate 4-epimerase